MMGNIVVLFMRILHRLNNDSERFDKLNLIKNCVKILLNVFYVRRKKRINILVGMIMRLK